MSQSRICSQFDSKCKHASHAPKSFLSLPANLRDKIYVQAGLIDSTTLRLRMKDGIVFFTSEHGSLPSTGDFYLIFCRARYGIPLLWEAKYVDIDRPEGFDVYLDLRLASRTINNDAARSLCCRNTILLERVDLSARLLERLSRSSLNPLRWVRRFTVILSSSNDAIESRRHAVFKARQDAEWDLSLYETYRPAWTKLISLLESSADTLTLEMSIACDIGDIDAAQRTIKALERLRPARCTVRLSGKRSRDLERLARSAAHSVTRIYANTTDCFRFLDLPTELRQLVLSFTDLITPFREVEWCPELGYSFFGWDEKRTIPCSHFCSMHYAVFPECECWKTPTRLFLVCRTMLHDTRALFFTFNRFIIVPSEQSSISDSFSRSKPFLSRQKGPFEASTFLREIVPREALAHLRDLEILFPAAQYNFRSSQGKYLTEWEDTIRLVAPYLRRLTLRIYMGVSRSSWRQAYIEPEDLQVSLARLCQAHVWIVRPLKQLQCLDGLVIRTWTPFEYQTWDKLNTVKYFHNHDKRLEAIVMGSTYDSTAYRTKERCVSKWREMYREELEDLQSQWLPHWGQSRLLSFIP